MERKCRPIDDLHRSIENVEVRGHYDVTPCLQIAWLSLSSVHVCAIKLSDSLMAHEWTELSNHGTIQVESQEIRKRYWKSHVKKVYYKMFSRCTGAIYTNPLMKLLFCSLIVMILFIDGNSQEKHKARVISRVNSNNIHISLRQQVRQA